MAGSDVIFLLIRILLVSAVPAVAGLAGIDLGSLVPGLSAVAAVFELVLVTCTPTHGHGKAKKSFRPARIFPLQIGALYALQLWWLCLHAMSTPAGQLTRVEHDEAISRPAIDQDTHSPVGRPDAGSAHGFLDQTLQPAPAPRFVPPVLQLVPSDPPAAAESMSLHELPPATAEVGASAGAFELDAPIESLRWEPKTMSVVLPCAEERDLALNTVKSVFNSLPPEKLHEIVVVDDGSNPPLSATHLTPAVQQQYKVKLLRHEETIGLIGAKKTGGDAATGDIVVFFDCHVGPQPDWYKDFFQLIGENYRRMVVPQITALDINTWTQIGAGGGMAKCYVTWDGDFKWGGEDDMYMAMISGGLLAVSRRWWKETGGYDEQMFGWGGENIDQAIRVWVCGGEIVMAPHAQVAHMWRTGDSKTNARYKHVGDTTHNRGRAMYAWYGDFTKKLDHFPQFAERKRREGDGWVGDMGTFQKVKDRLQGCRPFSWYLKRFKGIYEDAGIIPKEIFMIKEESSGKCLLFQGHAGTSGSGREGVVLQTCDPDNHRFFWHAGNKDQRRHACCSGLRAWNAEQCLEGGQPGGVKAVTGICDITGRNPNQHWQLHSDGQLKRSANCLGPGDGPDTLKEASCASFQNRGGGAGKFRKVSQQEPLEMQLYKKGQQEHPELFRKLDEELKSRAAESEIPALCRKNRAACVVAHFADGKGRCLDNEGQLTDEQDICAAMTLEGTAFKQVETGNCLDTWSDEDAETWGFYGCHNGPNQRFATQADGKVCVNTYTAGPQCFDTRQWTPPR